VDVIHNFVDPDVYNRARYPALLKNELARSKPILMHVSNFRTVKRVRDVIRIYAEVNRELPSVLVMIGDGPDRPAAEEEARLLGVEHSVSFLGKLDQIAPLLAAADLFLLPSQNESFGLSALEALASGVPVVGSNAGGLPEVVRDGETGTLCAVGDVAGMAAASVEILRDPGRWSEMSHLAAADARERFARDAIVSKYESLYRDTLTPINT
jgi:N-acetyl-alpha-D-glucosaminyl L-malate synthase BshA